MAAILLLACPPSEMCAGTHAQMLARITSADTGYLVVRPGDAVALLVNSLGATTPLELQIATRAALRQLERQHKVSSLARAPCAVSQGCAASGAQSP